MKVFTRQLLAGESLSFDDAYTLFSKLHEATIIEQAVILTLLAAKGESFDEVMGARDYLLTQSLATPEDIAACPSDLVDMVGTGGDGARTFNISTAASLVVASMGVPVAKHGGGRATSLSGSADLVEELGISQPKTMPEVMALLMKCDYVYLRGAYFNQGLRIYASLRSELGFPTIFNLLGPLLHPLCVKRQVIGVNRRALVPLFARVLKESGSVHALVVHAEEGLDELSVSGVTHVAEVKDGRVDEYVLDPSTFGFPRSTLKEIEGGAPKYNAQMIQSIFAAPQEDAKTNIVILNAAAGLQVAGRVANIEEGIVVAREAVFSGRVRAFLEQQSG